MALTATPSAPHLPVVAGVLIANNAIWFVPVLLASLRLASGEERREVATRGCFIGFLALGINQAVGLGWYHPRPVGPTFLAHAPDSSFAGDHATLLSAMALTPFYAGQRQPGLLALAVDIAVAWARVFVGVHFQFGMAGAAIVAGIGCISGNLLWRVGGMAVTTALIAIYRKVLALPLGQGWLRPWRRTRYAARNRRLRGTGGSSSH